MPNIYTYHPKKQAVLDAVERHWKTYAYPPSLREIMAIVDGRSTSHIRYLLLQLQEDGWIEMRGGRPVPWWVIDAIRIRSDARKEQAPADPLLEPEEMATHYQDANGEWHDGLDA